MPVVALPGVVALAAAVFALGLLWAIRYFSSAVGHLIPGNIPIIGSFLRNAVLYTAEVAEAAIQWIMADIIRPLANFILAPVYRFMDFLNALHSTVVALSESWEWLLNSSLPALFRAATSYAYRLYKDIQSYAGTLYHLAEHYAYALYKDAQTYAYDLYKDAQSYAYSLYKDAQSYAYSLYKDAQSYAYDLYKDGQTYAAGLVKSVEATLIKQIDAVEVIAKSAAGASAGAIAASAASTLAAATANTTAAVAAGIQAVDIDGVKGIEATWPGIIDDVGTLEGVIGTDLPAIGAAVRAIPTAIPTDISAAIAATAAISDVMVRYMRDCGVPNCRNLSQIGRDLKALFDLVEGATFLSLFAFIASDPAGAAHDAENFLGPIASDLTGAARDLIGV